MLLTRLASRGSSAISFETPADTPSGRTAPTRAWKLNSWAWTPTMVGPSVTAKSLAAITARAKSVTDFRLSTPADCVNRRRPKRPSGSTEAITCSTLLGAGSTRWAADIPVGEAPGGRLDAEKLRDSTAVEIAHLDEAAPVPRELADRDRDGLRSQRRHDASALAVNERLRVAADVGGDHRQRARHRLEQRDGESFLAGRKQEHVRIG